MEFDDHNFETLILLVQQHPCLYDMSLMSYRNKKFKRNVWKKIALEVHSDIETCKKKWKCLKDRYRRTKALIAKHGSNGGPKEWRLGKLMQFLDEFSHPRRPHNNRTEGGLNTSKPLLSIDCASKRSPNSQILIDEEELAVMQAWINSAQESLPTASTMANTMASTMTNAMATTMAGSVNNMNCIDFTHEDLSLPSTSDEAPPSMLHAHKASPSVKQRPLKRRWSEDSDPMRILNEIKLVNALETTVDEDELFFASLCAKSKKLPPVKRSKLQIMLLDTIHKALHDENFLGE